MSYSHILTDDLKVNGNDKAGSKDGQVGAV